MTDLTVHEIKMTDQGRIVVPQKLRRDLDFDATTRLVMYRDGDRLILERKGDARQRLSTLATLLAIDTDDQESAPHDVSGEVES
ncbi:AbrB/MazE/SpoVT family DNA-binding domain-containing protein [Deinococcus yavapaiensis]|nr:AbrB/MazE/SpoVT family DNA-binding domain-containing protein [Deinococcus yavapaiensis]